MKGYLRRFLNIYAGEERQSFLFVLLAFVWALGISCGVRFSDALFLIHIGADSLPTAYAATSCVLILAACFLLYAFHHFDTHRIFLSVIVLGLISYSLFWCFFLQGVGRESPVFWFAFKIFSYLLYSLVSTCFWLFVDQYHHLQDAKRLYTLFNCMIFIGFATTGGLMHSGVLQMDHLLILVLGLLLLTAYIIFTVSQKVSMVYDENEAESGSEEKQSLYLLLQSICKSPFTLLLMGSNCLVQMLTTITEYNYMQAFQKSFHLTSTLEGENVAATQLTAFLGECVAAVSLGNLLFGLFIYSRLVRRFGVSNLILFTPVALLCAFTGWTMSDWMLFSLIGFLAVEGIFYVIDDNTFTLLLNAVPARMKQKIRVTIEFFFVPTGMLVSALLLSLSSIDSRWLGLSLSAAALAMTVGMRSLYLQAVFQNLLDNAVHFQSKAKHWLRAMKKKEQKAAENRLLAIVKIGDEPLQISACEGLLAFADPTVLKKLLPLTYSLSNQVKLQLLHLLEKSVFTTDPMVIAHLQVWSVEEQDPILSKAIDFYLAKQGLIPVDEVVSQPIEGLLESEKIEDICKGLTLLGVEATPKHQEMLLPFITHSHPKVATAAAASLARIIQKGSLEHAPLLISQLAICGDNEFRLTCLRALGKIADATLVKDIIAASIHFRPNEKRLLESLIFKIGKQAVPVLLEITKVLEMHDRCRMMACRILGRLHLSVLQAHLYEIIRIEMERAYFYIYHHFTIQDQYPEHNLKLLQDALLTDFQSVIDFIIHLLGAAGSIEDCELLSRSLRSRNLKVRAQVVETLEKSCDSKIFLLLLPLISHTKKEILIQTYLKKGGEPLTLTQLLDFLGQSPSQADRMMSSSLKFYLNLAEENESLSSTYANDEIKGVLVEA